jgi:hypothetical protein
VDFNTTLPKKNLNKMDPKKLPLGKVMAIGFGMVAVFFYILLPLLQ